MPSIRNLTVKFAQETPEAVFLLPSAEGAALVRGSLRTYKVPFEDTVVRFAGKDVLAIKIDAGVPIKYMQKEMKDDTFYYYYVYTTTGVRYTFRIAIYVYGEG